MTITSKYNSRCKRCGGQINIGDRIEWSRVAGATHVKCEPRETQPTTSFNDMSRIVLFITRAKDRGLKSPKLRVLDVDNTSELRLSLTTKGRAPGSVVVKRDGNYLGVIRQTGEAYGRAFTKELVNRIDEVSRDPETAAKQYAALMGRCSFCGLTLTDAGSVEVGYGPVCAKHWGLPHSPKGTPVLHKFVGERQDVLLLS